MAYINFWGNPEEYIELLTVGFHPIYNWCLDSDAQDLRTAFNVTIKKVLKLDDIAYQSVVKDFNGKIIGSCTYFRKYENAEAFREWVLAMITMNKLQMRL